MLQTVFRVLAQVLRLLATRVILIASLALVALGAAAVVGSLMPAWLVDWLDAGSLDTILQILASSMLAVTTFSLSILTGAIQFASSSITPRTRLLLRDDTVTNMVLSNFVGAFVFALIGIVLRATPVMGDKESAMLFLFTIVVVAGVVVSILRWIEHLSTLGAMDQTVVALEQTANRVMDAFTARPALGGHAVSRDDLRAKTGCPVLMAHQSGYVEQIFERILQTEADKIEADLYFAVYPGDYVVPETPLIYADGVDDLSDDTRQTLLGGIQITDTRRFDQDPRLAVIVLTEVASRALSPGINDSQTAIDVVHRLSAVLLRDAAEEDGKTDDADPENNRLYMVAPTPDQFLKDSFDVIARDGDGKSEILSAIDAALSRMEQLGPEAMKSAAHQCRTRIGLDQENG